MVSLMRFASASVCSLSWRSYSLSPGGGRRIAARGSARSVLWREGVRIIMLSTLRGIDGGEGRATATATGVMVKREGHGEAVVHL